MSYALLSDEIIIALPPSPYLEAMDPCPTHPAVNYSRDFLIGVFLAVGSSAFIGTSFIVKKKGLLR